MKELEQFGILEKDISLKKYNTYRLETEASYVLHPNDVGSLLSFLEFAQQNDVPYFILGNGSNVIFSDSKYEGVIVKLDLLNHISYEGQHVTVGAGVMMNFLALEIIKNGLSGLEWASGTPGTVGGCIFGNAEAYKTSTFEYLTTVTYIDKDLHLIKKEKDKLSHGYRTSYFKEHPENIIIEATFTFPKGTKEQSLELIRDRLQRRLSTQPLEYPSAGSVFRNPSSELASGKLIDDLGLKGKQIGGACISEKHANFIINIGGATGKDIRDLIKLIQEKVKEVYQIDLILEQETKDW